MFEDRAFTAMTYARVAFADATLDELDCIERCDADGAARASVLAASAARIEARASATIERSRERTKREQDGKRLADARAAILRALASEPRLTKAAIAHVVGRRTVVTMEALASLVETGAVVRTRDGYALAPVRGKAAAVTAVAV